MNEAKVPPQQVLFQMMTGHWVGQLVATVARLGVADRIKDGVGASDELATATQTNPDGMFRILRAASSVGIMQEVEPRRFKLTPVGQALRNDVPGSMRDIIMAELAPSHWLPWGQLFDAAKSGQSRTKEALGMEAWTYYDKHPEESACFARGMSNLSNVIASEVVPKYDFSKVNEVIDVGGSQGVILNAILSAAPNAKGVLFDRPEVIESGKAAVIKYPTASRIRSVAGDFFKEVPTGADLYVLKHIIHDWSDELATKILSTIARCARKDSKLLLIEMVVPPAGAPPIMALMDLNMLVMCGGRERTESEFGTLLAKGGWKLSRVIPSQGMCSLVEATRASTDN